MKVIAFQHAPTEPLGFFESVFTEKNVPFEYVRLYEDPKIPRIDATHFVFLGGSMSVNDETELPYLKEEKEVIRCAVQAKKPVLGICLGAQLIASAFGAKVYKFVKEIGWHELCREEQPPGIFSQFPDRFSVFQFHGETFEIPYGGRLLCTGKDVRNQAFLYKTALGLQFHVELTDKIIRDWSRDLKPYQRERIKRETPRYLAESNRLCRMISEDFLFGELRK